MVLSPVTVALVPLRGGSKSIPDKNIKPMAGKPMCAWAIEAALASRAIGKVYVSTDSERIAETVRRIDSSIGIIERPAELAQDTSSTESVMLHFAGLVPFDHLFTVQATSPMTRSADFDAAWDRLRAEGWDSLVTGVRTKRFFWTPEGAPLNYDPLKRPRRQDFDGLIMENGAFYVTKAGILREHRCRLGGKIGVYEMDPSNAVELDEPEDWELLERHLRARAGG